MFEQREWDIDWDDAIEAFLGALAAGAVLMVVSGLLAKKGRRRRLLGFRDRLVVPAVQR